MKIKGIALRSLVNGDSGSRHPFTFLTWKSESVSWLLFSENVCWFQNVFSLPSEVSAVEMLLCLFADVLRLNIPS